MSPRVKVWTIGRARGGPRNDPCGPFPARKTSGGSTVTADRSSPTSQGDRRRDGRSGGDKPFAASGSIHSPETGSPEMLMELAYRLAVEDSAHIQAIRKNLIVCSSHPSWKSTAETGCSTSITTEGESGQAGAGTGVLGKYVDDNNRDAMGLAQRCSNVMMKTFSGLASAGLPRPARVGAISTPRPAPAYNSWLDPIVVSEWQKLAYHEIEGMTRRGVPGSGPTGFTMGGPRTTCSTSPTATTRSPVL